MSNFVNKRDTAKIRTYDRQIDKRKENKYVNMSCIKIINICSI